MNVTTCIALFSLCFTFMTGIYASREVRNMRDYGLSKGMFSSFPLICTIIASFVGGGVIIGTAEKTFTSGLGPVIGLLGFPAQLFLTGLLIAPRIGRFPDAISVGDILGSVYGKGAKTITGLCWFLFSIGIVVAQMTVLSKTLDLLLNLNSGWNLLLGSGIVVLYCFLGGIRAVVTTDVIQFLILAISLPLTLFVGLHQQGGFQAVVERIPETYLTFTGEYHPVSLAVVFFSFLLGDAFIPPVVQRMLMARTPKQAQGTMIAGGIGAIPFCFIGAGLGLLAYSLNTHLLPSQVIPHLFSVVLPPAIRGFAIAGILATITSTADSYLNSAAIAFVNDIVKPLSRRPVHGIRELYLAKITTLVIGIVAMIISISAVNVFDVLLQTYKFWGPTVVIPLGALFFDKPVTRSGFYLSLSTGVASVLLWDYFRLQEATYLSSLIVGIVGNFVVYTICRQMQAEKSVVENRMLSTRSA